MDNPAYEKSFDDVVFAKHPTTFVEKRTRRPRRPAKKTVHFADTDEKQSDCDSTGKRRGRPKTRESNNNKGSQGEVVQVEEEVVVDEDGVSITCSVVIFWSSGASR